MKKKIHTLITRIGILFLVLPMLVSSCLHEEPEWTADGKKGVDPTQVNVMTELKLDLQLSAVDQNKIRTAEANGYYHRFTVTAYEGKQVASQQVIYEPIRSGETELSLPISLKLHARKYQLAVWADYVQKTDVGYTLFYNAGNMERIVRPDSYKANSTYYDAFYGTSLLDLTSYRDQWNVEIPIDIKMIRPLARYNLIATDVAKFKEMIKNGKSGKTFTATVKYSQYLTTGFNALTGQVKNSLLYIEYSKPLPLPEELTTDEYNVGFDYVFVNGEDSFVSLTIEITNEKGVVVARCKGVKVPYKQGHTTNASGRFLTSNPKPGIDIDTDFDGDINVDLDFPGGI